MHFIDHLILNSSLFLFNCQMCFDSSVLYLYFSCLMDCIWFAKRCLSLFSVSPIIKFRPGTRYSLKCDVTSAGWQIDLGKVNNLMHSLP